VAIGVLPCFHRMLGAALIILHLMVARGSSGHYNIVAIVERGDLKLYAGVMAVACLADFDRGVICADRAAECVVPFHCG
jgi:hypothetical protein